MRRRVQIFFLILIFMYSGCEVSSWKDIFTLKSVKKTVTARDSEDIEDLKGEAAEYEKVVYKKVEAADRLGIIYEKLGKKYLASKVWDLAIESFEKGNRC